MSGPSGEGGGWAVSKTRPLTTDRYKSDVYEWVWVIISKVRIGLN